MTRDSLNKWSSQGEAKGRLMNFVVDTPAYIERFGALLMTCFLMADSDYDMGVFTRMSYLLSFTYMSTLPTI